MGDGFIIAVLLTVHNRVRNTLLCLGNLYQQDLADSTTELSVFLVDDGSTDTTYKEISTQFPHITLIQGSGNLYWNQGMRLAWSTALADTRRFDAYLWLNNDTLLFPSALDSLVAVLHEQVKTVGQAGIAVGSCIGNNSVGTKTTTYGGRGPRGMIQPDISSCTPANAMNGNCVLVSQNCVEKIGIQRDLIWKIKFGHALNSDRYWLHNFS
jgi:GT2 family glycosyltransferase